MPFRIPTSAAAPERAQNDAEQEFDRMERRTYSAKPKEVQRSWFVVDAEGKTLGRLATAIAATLRGKHKATYTPHIDTGDFVVVVNAGKVKVTGNKDADKVYYRHSNYPGGLKATTLRDMRKRHPERILEEAVKGMLPRTSLGRQQLKKLKLYTGPDHPHAAQQPAELSIDDTASR
jgi:large subunit ribosomal protein L13